MASKEFEEFRTAWAAMPMPDPPPDLETRRRGLEDAAPPTPDDIQVTPVDAGGVPADWVLAPEAEGDRRLLYLHGGGFSLGSALSHRRLAADLSRASGCAVLNADYRLAPEHEYPAAVDDALAAYIWMMERGPEGEGRARSAFVAGDSAGGNLTLALLLAVRDRGITPPAAAIAISPVTDLTLTGASLKTRVARDPIISEAAVANLPDMVATYLGSADLKAPLASPLFAELHDLPPLYMNVGDDEVLLDDTLRFAARAADAGVDVTLHVEPAGFHVYPYFVPDAPESRFTIRRMGEFIRHHG